MDVQLLRVLCTRSFCSAVHIVCCPIQVESFANDMQQSGLVMSHSCLWPWHARCMTHICFCFFWLVCSGHYFCWVYRGLQGMNTSSTLCSWAMPVLDLASRSVRKQPFAKPMLKALRPINMCLAKMEQNNFSIWESFRNGVFVESQEAIQHEIALPYHSNWQKWNNVLPPME